MKKIFFIGIFILFILPKLSFSQKYIYFTPHAGGNFVFCREFASLPEYKVRQFDYSPLSTFGLALRLENSKNRFITIGYEQDENGYATYEEKQVPFNYGIFQNSFVVRKRMARNEIERIYFYGRFPIFQKKQRNLNKIRVKPYLISGISYDWSVCDFEANTFVSSNIRDTIFTNRQNNISLWLGGHLVLLNKDNKKVLELQIHLKKGINILYGIIRYDYFTGEVVQLISVYGSNLTLTLGIPLKIVKFRKNEKKNEAN
ncbi:MAG: hypothetical protein NZ516_01315 [Raineya sp.]|nr:hypothetical protein [Raineya sp.]